MRLGIVWKFKLPWPKKEELHKHLHMTGRHLWWNTCSDGKSGLTEGIVMGTGWSVLFYGRQSLGEGLSLGEVQDAMFTLSGALSWVGKEAQLTTNPLNLWEGRWLIAQTDTKGCIEARGPKHPCSWLPVSPPFGFHSHAGYPQEERLQCTNKCMEEPRHTCLASHHDCTLWQGWDHGQR